MHFALFAARRRVFSNIDIVISILWRFLPCADIRGVAELGAWTLCIKRVTRVTYAREPRAALNRFNARNADFFAKRPALFPLPFSSRYYPRRVIGRMSKRFSARPLFLGERTQRDRRRKSRSFALKRRAFADQTRARARFLPSSVRY